MKDFRQKMKAKGWSKKEIDDAIKKMHSPKKKHKEYAVYSSSILYWTTLLVLLVSNLLVAIVLIPFLVVIDSGFIYLIIALLGFVFGILFNHLIRDIEHLERHHHVAATVFIPLVAVLNLFAIIPVTNTVRMLLELGPIQSPVVIAATYVCAFILPYLWSSIREGLEK